MEQQRLDILAKARSLVREGRLEELNTLLTPLHASDVADVIQECEVQQQIAVLKSLGTERAAEVLIELDSKSGLALLHLLSDHEVVALLGELPSDDAADLISTLPPEKTERVEALLPSDERAEIQELLEFGPETAGGLMQIERVWVRESATIQDAIDFVRKEAGEMESPQRVYVVDAGGHLLGMLSILDLVVREPGVRVRDVMERHVPSVPVGMDQEQVAALFSKYDEFTMPVVDTGGRLVGRITMDDVIDVVQEEASQDIAAIAGTTDEELGERSFFRISGIRLPWLIMGFFGEMVGAFVMSRYQPALATFVVLAYFIPLIVATAGNHGMQAAIVAVREIALGSAGIKHIGHRVMVELRVALLNGLVLGLLLFAFVMVWLHDAELGALLWTSLMLTILVASFIGAAAPLLLHRWKVDPAVATGPFITVSNDVVGMAIYLSLATAYLRRH